MRGLLFFLMPLMAVNTYSQVNIEKTIAIKAEQIFNDPFGFIYSLSSNELVKMNSEGDMIHVFQHEKRNRISGGDFNHPLKILLFIDNRPEILILDHYLSKIEEFDVSEKMDVSEEVIIIGSESGGFYLYDRFSGQLIKLDSSFKREYVLELRTNLPVKSLVEFDRKIFVQFESGELSTYDFISGEFNAIAIEKIKQAIHITGQHISIYNPDKHRIEFYDTGFLYHSFIDLPAELTIIDAVYLDEKVVFIDGDSLYISRVQRD